MKKIKRVIKQPAPGIPGDSRAPFWNGETAGRLVRRRAKAVAAEKLAKAEARAAARSSRGGSFVHSGPGSSRSPSALLRRLERALARRKTLAARQRIQQQIDTLRAEAR